MTRSADLAHSVTALVKAPAQLAFEFLSDPIALGGWSLGCMSTRAAEDGLYTGQSLFNGAQSWFTIDAHAQLLLVDYRTGIPGELVPRISARVVPPEVCDLADNQCYVSLNAWRTSHMNEERWAALCATHEAEIWLIKAQIESRWRAATEAAAADARR